MQQGSEEWFAARRGKATASEFKNILAKLKTGGEPAGRRNYRTQLVLERITGRTPERFQNDAMRWGQQMEEAARLAYFFKTGRAVEKTGFIAHPELAAGASPDGLVGDDGGIEIKCLNSANHLEVLHMRQVPSEHVAQILGNLWITGRKWWDFVSYDPDMPLNSRIFIMRVLRDESSIAMIEQEVRTFLSEVEAEVSFLENYNG